MLIISALLISTGQVRDQTPETGVSENTHSAEVPQWQISEFWRYSIQYDKTTTEIDLVCYDLTDNDYFIGTSSRDHAMVHAVYNINPMLGRQTVDNLDVYENGVPKSMFAFPLTDGSSWQNTLYGHDFTVNAEYCDNIETSLGSFSGFEISARSADGISIAYDFIPALNWFSKLVIEDSNSVFLEMTLKDHDYGFKGEVYFMRARDLYDASSSSGGNDFSVSGHPKYGDFDFLAVGITTETINTPMFVEISGPVNDYSYPVFRTSGTKFISEIPNYNGDWSVDYYSRMFLFYQPEVDVKIAGVLEYSAVL
jgi:hypothetical protein